MLTGLFSALNLSCWTIAFQSEKSATVSLFAYIALVYAFLADIIIYKAHFNPLEVVGASIITFFNIFTIWWQHKYPEVEEVTKKEESLEEELRPMINSSDEKEDPRSFFSDEEDKNKTKTR